MKWFERLRQVREAKGMKKAHLAKAIGVQPPTITEWENGVTVTPSGANVLALCRVLNVTPEWLMEGPRGGQHSQNQTYFGSDEKIAKAVALLESMPEDDQDQALAILDTIAARALRKT